jgi:transposase
VPRNRGENLTLVAALSAEGLGAAMTLDGALDAPAFEAYVRELLAPTRRPGQTVIMDNLRSHQGDTARRLIEARGCRLIFLPAYSPDLTPIELAFAKLKALLRKAGQRTVDGLWEFLGQALDAFGPEECGNYFRHCGYPATPNSKPL